MEIYGYQSCGGRKFLADVSRKALPIVLTIIEGIRDDGLTNFDIKTIEKKSRPIIKEIRKGGVRLFFYEENNAVHITNVTSHKQKNKTQKTDKELAITRQKSMRENPEKHQAKIC